MSKKHSEVLVGTFRAFEENNKEKEHNITIWDQYIDEGTFEGNVHNKVGRVAKCDGVVINHIDDDTYEMIRLSNSGVEERVILRRIIE